MLAGATILMSQSVHAHWVYVSNEKDDTVSVIDTPLSILKVAPWSHRLMWA